MPKFLAVLVLLVASLASSKALACEGADRAVGPLCIGQGVYEAGSRHVLYSVARFADDDSRTVVWEGNGYVETATRKKMVVTELRVVEGKGIREVDVVYTWNGRKFVEKKRR